LEAEPSPVEVRDLGTATKAAGVSDAEWDEGLGCGVGRGSRMRRGRPDARPVGLGLWARARGLA